MSRKLDGLIDAIAERYRTEHLQNRLQVLEDRKRALEAQLADGPAPAEPRLHPNVAELYRRRVEQLHAPLDDPQEG